KNHRARQINLKDFEEFDIIYTMATDVHAEVLSLTNNKMHHKKIIHFMSVLEADKLLSVPDPWYGNEAGFEPVFVLIEKGCKKILAELIA
ncbi:MAG: low molecular weight phosphotyrosine protein phosphatase, partial [Pseudomonadota bacterium]